MIKLFTELSWAHLASDREETSPRNLCATYNYLYLVGFKHVSGGKKWYLELRLKKNGNLIKTLVMDSLKGYGLLSSCIALYDKVYAVGDNNENWAFVLFDLDLNALRMLTAQDVRGTARVVISDGNSLYVGGKEKIGDVYRWRIEKREFSDLFLQSIYTSDEVSELDDVFNLGVNPSTGHIWAVGSDGGRGYTEWKIEILDCSLNLRSILKPGIYGRALGIVFDYGGNAYVYGEGGIVKYDKEGRELARTKSSVESGMFVGEKLFFVDSLHQLRIFDTSLRYIGDVHLGTMIEKVTQNMTYVRRLMGGIRIFYDGKNIFGIVSGGRVDFTSWGWIVFAMAIKVPITVSVLDGFDKTRKWHMEILDLDDGVVAKGTEKVNVMLLYGNKYLVRVYGPSVYDFQFSALGNEIAVHVPTGRISVAVVDGFGRFRDDWIVTVGDAVYEAGRAKSAEVMAGEYSVKVRAFGKDFTKLVKVDAGKDVSIVLEVPTALLSVVASGENGELIRPEVVLIKGPIEIAQSSLPLGLEVLAGEYEIEVIAGGKSVKERIVLRPGDSKIARIYIY
jgi:hypothetical protein